jgi:uncharacterized protein YyaL (SSP411 family)
MIATIARGPGGPTPPGRSIRKHHPLTLKVTAMGSTNALHPHHDKLVHADGSPRYTNALAQQTSPYLLQHAHNPVDWLAWGEAAFTKARDEDKPIFLSVGYSTCYWCHVMERQVFESPALAHQLNDACVAIKVDREERPDVDELYMTATQLMTGHGGWPMSVFLTPPRARGDDDPGLKPFWAGTYLPPEPMHGMASFPQIIEAISDAWQNQRQAVLDQADKVADAIGQHLGGPAAPGEVSADAVQRLANQLMHHYDREHGGFGGAPKFPQPATLQMLIAVYDNNHLASMRQAVEHTLDRMARGGIFDQIGGAFHRYSTDAKWLVPHFEKMLYDNGQLLETYALAYPRSEQTAMRRAFDRTLRETADYVLREMVDASGAFYSAQDAEVHGREGGSYLWTGEQVRAAIEDETLASTAEAMYGLDRGTNFKDPHDPDTPPANVLYLPQPLEELADAWGESIETVQQRRRDINGRLLAARNARPQPRTDDKVLVGWNGLMIAGLAKAGAVLDEPRYIEAAREAAEAIERQMRRADGSLYRSMRQNTRAINGQLEDYALYAHGLIELHRAVGEAKWLDQAIADTDHVITHFAAEQGGYYDTLADQADLLVRPHSAVDGSMPSGNSQMVHNLLDLYETTGEDGYLARACDDLKRFAEPLTQQAQMMPHMAHALLRALELAPHRFQAQPAKQQPGERREASAEPVQLHADCTTLDLSKGEAALTVTLKPTDGYHITAHEPGDTALAPLHVELAEGAGLEMTVDYPEPTMKQYLFADKPVGVHEQPAVVHVRLTAAAGESMARDAMLVVHYQPCSDRACFEPRREEVALRITGTT